MWNIYQQAITWGQKPSAIFGVEPECQYLCYCFDEAVLLFGKWVEKWLAVRHDKGRNKGKPMYRLEQILDDNFKEQQYSTSLRGLLALMGSAAGMA
jgi:hypothetical protein